MDMRTLIVGGAGFIGSSVANHLYYHGYDVTVIDSLENGIKERLNPEIQFVRADMALSNLEMHFDVIMNFAAYASVPDSVKDPLKYYNNNINILLNLLKGSDKNTKFIFSSTAAVYGEPQETPIKETHSLIPCNPYGQSKLTCENMIRDYARATGMKYTIFRYFSAAGSVYNIRESYTAKEHVLPKLITRAKMGLPLEIYGTDYETRDGTCVRDFVDIEDMCLAHELAITDLEGEYNLGSGEGFTIREIIESIGRHMKVKVKERPRREGDPSVLIADIKKIKKIGWKPRKNLDQIVDSVIDLY